jgi:hypothetical protein
MPAPMLPPALPGGQPRPPMPMKAPRAPIAKKKKAPKPAFQAGPKGPGGFGVMPPPQMGGQPQMKRGGGV